MDSIQIGHLESLDVVPLSVAAPGITSRLINIRGNSLLSSVYVHSLSPGATLKVNYYDYTSGFDLGQRHNLRGHELISTIPPGGTDRVLVSNIHDKLICEAVVIGGSVHFSVYVTAVDTFASDIDSALVKDGEIVNYLLNRGIPFAVVDSDGKWRLVRGTTEGRVYVVGIAPDVASRFHGSAASVTTPGSLQELLSFQVPEGKTRNLTRVVVLARTTAIWTFKDSGDVVLGSGRLGPGQSRSEFSWTPEYPAAALESFKVEFFQHADCPETSVESYVMGYDVLE